MPFPRSRTLLWVGSLLALFPMLSLAIAAWLQFDRMREDEAARLMGTATVIEDHASRSVDAVGNALSALAEHVMLEGVLRPATLTPLLQQSMAALPMLRSLAAIDAQGQVLASTVAAEVGLVIDTSLLGVQPEAGHDALGEVLRGGGLVHLARDHASMPSLARGTMLPLVRRVRLGGTDALLVALIDPDRFASYQQLAVRDEHTVAVLTSYQGRVIAALPWAPVKPGQRLLGHPLFTDFELPRERGNLIGPGLREGTQLTGYRVSRHRPLVVLVELPRSRLVAQWLDVMQPLLLGRVVVTLGLVALTAYAWLALRSHERAQRGQQSVHEAVENRERQLTELFKLVPEMIFRVGRDGRVSFVNGRYTDVSGRSAQQAVGQWLPELFLPASREAVAALFDPQRGRTPRRAIGLLGGPYGIERRFDITVVPLYDGEELRGFAGSAVDETERLLLQDKLRGQVEFTARLLELVPVPVSIIDRDGRFMSVNQAWESFNQRRREEVLGRVAGEHWTQADRQAQRERDEQLLRHGGSDSAELLYTRVDQSRRLVRMNKVAVPGEDGQPVAVMNAFLDLTEFREAERAIAAAREAAEQVSRHKSDFIASVSHELRTPLQAILGFTEIGRQRSLDPQRQQALLEEIHRAGQGMLRMVNELLELARLERLPRADAGLVPALDLRGVVESVRRALDPLVAQRQVVLSTALPQRPLAIALEPGAAEELVGQLLRHAIEVTPAGGAVEVIGWAAGGATLLQVRDGGPSIAAGQLHRLFEPFSSVHPSKGSSEGATGLGLAIARRIALAAEGELKAVGRPEGGTLLELSLPQAAPPAPVPEASAAAQEERPRSLPALPAPSAS